MIINNIMFRNVLLLLYLITISNAAVSQNVDELSIYNSLMDSLYNINTCLKIVKPPYYKCCDNDTLYGKDRITCCEKSLVPPQYRINCSRCINQQAYDSLDQVMVVSDTLASFSLGTEKKYMLKQLTPSSKFYSFIKGIKKPVSKRWYHTDSLHQGRIRFITDETFTKEDREYWYGKRGKQIFLGYFFLSRFYVDNSKGLGIFFMDWVGGGTCGYKKFILIYKEGNVWKIGKKIWIGVY